MFIERKIETDLVLNYLNKKTTQLITISGRRRVGKTFFVKNILRIKEAEGKICLNFVGNNLISEKENLTKCFNSLEYQISTLFFLNKEQKDILMLFLNKEKTWDNFFNLIISIAKFSEKEIILFLDEINWFSKNDNFLIDFTQKVNEILGSNKNIKIIIASSISSWIKKNIIQNTGGLYHRTSLYLKLKPFSLFEIINFIKSKNYQISKKTILEYYLMFGGIPLYYELLDYNLTFEQNIKIIKDKKNIFIEERDLLLKSLIKNNDYSKKIIEILSKSKMLSQDEILEKMKYYFPLIKSKSLQNNIYSSLKDLEESDLILGLEKDGYLNNKTYFVNDLFGYFNYYWWSSEFKKDLNFNSQEYNNWKGQAFEIFIFNHLEFFLKDLNIDIGNYEKILNFNSSNKKVKLSKIEKERKDDFLKKNKKAQIDLLIKQKSKKENVYSIIECKYYNKEFLLYEKELDDLNNKMIELHYLIGEKNIQNLILITLNGSKIMDKNYSLLSNIIHLNLSNYLID